MINKIYGQKKKMSPSSLLLSSFLPPPVSSLCLILPLSSFSFPAQLNAHPQQQGQAGPKTK